MNTGFQGLPISEVVPDAVAGMQEGLSKSSLLVSRRKIRFQPQTGTSATPGSIVQFVLADSSSLLDVNSATISFTITTSTAGTAAATWALPPRFLSGIDEEVGAPKPPPCPVQDLRLSGTHAQKVPRFWPAHLSARQGGDGGAWRLGRRLMALYQHAS